MKRALLTHPKTNDLAFRLQCSRPTAIGYLALLFDFCAVHSPQGNIGKWPNGVISLACEWDGDADFFIESLINSKWLDENELHRLLVHDWGDNCENWVRAKLHKKGLKILSYEPSYDALTVAHVRDGVRGKGKGKGKRVRLKKPTLEDVAAYCQERGNTVDPQRWMDHYTSNGWKVGKNPMKDWKAAVRTWERNGFDKDSEPLDTSFNLPEDTDDTN